MKKNAILDLVILACIFWAIWSLRFMGVENVGLWTMVFSILVGYLLLRIRKESLSTIGLVSWRQPIPKLRKQVLEVAGIIALISFGGFMILVPLLGPLETSNAITTQPNTFGPFLLDIIFGVWIGAALGEEIFFRGFLLSRFEILFNSFKYKSELAVLAQAIWFGSGHASQGITGMVLTGFIGLGIGLYYIKICRGNLWPLIIAHGLIDTLVLSLNFFGGV